MNLNPIKMKESVKSRFGGMGNPQAPFKTYSKTDPVDLPPVKAQVLRGGKLVDAPVR
jgi:hypothetical protein